MALGCPLTPACHNVCGSAWAVTRARGAGAISVPDIDCCPTIDAGCSTAVIGGTRSIVVGGIRCAGAVVVVAVVVVATSPAAVAALPSKIGSTTVTLNAMTTTRAARATERFRPAVSTIDRILRIESMARLFCEGEVASCLVDRSPSPERRRVFEPGVPSRGLLG